MTAGRARNARAPPSFAYSRFVSPALPRADGFGRLRSATKSAMVCVCGYFNTTLSLNSSLSAGVVCMPHTHRANSTQNATHSNQPAMTPCCMPLSCYDVSPTEHH